MNMQKHIKHATIAALVLVTLYAGLFLYAKLFVPDNTQTMTTAEIKRPELVAKKLHVSKSVAREIVAQAEEVVKHPPAISYTVPAKTIPEAAKVVEKQIKEDKVPVKLPPADKTIVIPTDVDVKVYRINLDKPKFGINALVLTDGAKTEVGAGISWKNKNTAVNIGYTTEKRYYIMGVKYF